MRMKTQCIIGLALIVCGCAASGPPPDPTPTPTPTHEPTVANATTEEDTLLQAPWSIRFADGNGNTTYVTQLSNDAEVTYEYSPVTPRMSSSGIYSGGKPSSGIVQKSDVAELWRRVEALQKETSRHVDTRQKGTGHFEVTRDGSTTQFVYPNRDELRSFVEFLDGLQSSDGQETAP